MRIKYVLYLLMVVIILAAIAMIPFLDGYLFKQNYIAAIRSINATHKIHVAVVNYQIGWFSSTVKLSVDPYQANQAHYTKTPQSLMLDQVVHHGPYVMDPLSGEKIIAQAVIETDATLPLSLKVFLSNPSQRSDFHMDTVVTLFNEYEGQFSTSPFVITKVSPLGKIMWEGLKGDSKFTIVHDNIDHVSTNVIIGAISSLGGTDAIASKPMNIQQDMHFHAMGVWGGSYQFTSPGVVYSDTNGPIVTVAGLTISTAFGVNEKNLYSHDFSVALLGLATANETINSSSIKLSEKDINAHALADVLNASAKLTVLFNVAPQQFDDLYRMLPQLITPTTVIHEAMNINTSDGQFISEGQLDWAKAAALKTMNDVMMNANIKLNFRISASLVDKILMSAYGASENSSTTTANAAAVVSTSEPTEASILNAIDVWSSQGQVTLYISYQLDDLVKKHLDSDVFAVNLDQYVLRKEITPDIDAQLKNMYEEFNPNPKNKDKKPKPVPVVQAVTETIVTPADRVKQKINSLVSKGYLKQYNNDYVATVTYIQGVWQLNGIAVSLPELMAP